MGCRACAGSNSNFHKKEKISYEVERMNERKKQIKIFVEDSGRVICREGTLIGETADFMQITNERGATEAIAKRLIVRYLEVA